MEAPGQRQARLDRIRVTVVASEERDARLERTRADGSELLATEVPTQRGQAGGEGAQRERLITEITEHKDA